MFWWAYNMLMNDFDALVEHWHDLRMNTSICFMFTFWFRYWSWVISIGKSCEWFLEVHIYIWDVVDWVWGVFEDVCEFGAWFWKFAQVLMLIKMLTLSSCGLRSINDLRLIFGWLDRLYVDLVVCKFWWWSEIIWLGFWSGENRRLKLNFCRIFQNFVLSLAWFLTIA